MNPEVEGIVTEAINEEAIRAAGWKLQLLGLALDRTSIDLAVLGASADPEVLSAFKAAGVQVVTASGGV